MRYQAALRPDVKYVVIIKHLPAELLLHLTNFASNCAELCQMDSLDTIRLYISVRHATFPFGGWLDSGSIDLTRSCHPPCVRWLQADGGRAFQQLRKHWR